MKRTLKHTLRQALRLFELAVAVALLTVLTELVLIQLNTREGGWESSSAAARGSQQAGAAPSPAPANPAAPLQIAAKPVKPPVAPKPPAPVRPVPVPPPQIVIRPPSPEPRPLLSFHYLRQEIRNFVQIIWAPISQTTVILASRAPNTANTNATTLGVPWEQNTSPAPNPVVQTNLNPDGAGVEIPAGPPNSRPDAALTGSGSPDFRNTNGMFRLAMP